MGFVMLLHSYGRWVLLVVAAVITLKALVGWLGKQPWRKLDDQLGLAYTIVMDIQFLLGLIVWLFGSTGVRMLANAMGNAYGRFIAMEHGLLIVIALVLAHMGRARTKKATSDAIKQRTAVIFYGLSFLFVALVFVMEAMVR